MLHAFDPRLADKPQLRENSSTGFCVWRPATPVFSGRVILPHMSSDLFEREKRKATHPINAALNYGYGFLYHAIEWQCLACGLDPTIGIIHKLRRSRPSLACDLIEPLRCIVELTVVRNLDDLQEPSGWPVILPKCWKPPFSYREDKFKLRSIIRLMVESFVRSLDGRGSLSTFCSPCS